MKTLVFAKTWPKRSFSIQSVPEIIDPVFAKTSQYARFLLSENERFGLVFVKTGSINSGTVPRRRFQLVLDEIRLGVVSKYWNCVEEEISMFSCPKSDHIRWQVFTKSEEFAKVECT
jgi:hypothetical protein